MRIRRLDLDFFGHFTARRFDFGETGSGADFHIIHGPNEAGKTTTKEAFLRLLYGFPLREPYDFQHQRKNLRVSGLLETPEGLRSFTRLSTRNASLVDANGTPLPESALSTHLGGLSLDDYRNLLCLDDETIERGGEDIANARGDIGRLLFSAAAGVADLSAVLDHARAEADTLYRKRASTTRMAALKKDLADVERQIREGDVTASAWRRLRQTRDQAAEEEEAIRAERERLRREAAAIDARRRALPLLAEIDALEEAIAPHAALPGRLDIDAETLVSLLTDQTRAVRDAERLVQEITELQELLAGIVPDPDDLRLAGQLDDLDTLRSRYTAAGLDLPRRRIALRDILHDMGRAASDLGAGEDVSPASLVCPPAGLSALEAAREALRTALRDREGEAREVAALEARRREALKALEDLEREAPPATGVSALLERHDADRLAPAHAAALQSVETARLQLREALDALALGGRSFETVPHCPFSPDDARAMAGRLDALDRKIAELRERIAGHRETAALSANDIERLTAGRALIADRDAVTAIDERDRLWSAHRAVLSDESAAAFEASMRRVDDMAQSRLAQARELAELRQAEKALADAETLRAQAEGELARLEAQKAGLETEIATAASAAGLDPATSPAAFFPWVDRLAAAAAAHQRLARIREKHRTVLEKADALLTALRPLLDRADPDFDACLDAARRLSVTEREHGGKVRAAGERLGALDRELAARRERLAALEAEADRMSDGWTELVTDLFAGRIAPDVLETSLEPLRDLRELETRRAAAERQISAMEEDQRQFSEGIAPLAASRAMPAGDDPLAAFDALRQRAAAAAQAFSRRKEIEDSLERKTVALAEARQQLDDIGLQVRQWGAPFPEGVPVATLTELRAAVALTQEIIGKRNQRDVLVRQVLDALSVPDLAAARAALRDETSAGLLAAAQERDADLEAIDDRLTRATEARTSADRDLAAVTGDADIALLVERKATLEIEMEETVLDYLELTLGLRLADAAIRSYRDAHRSGMMAATEAVFATLTNGAYRHLRSQPDGASEVLLVVDASGAAKRVEDLSKGTRFQLYLALRAAAYEQLGEQGIHLPFFCDDIFETFDEDRTRAACRIMERIGRSGQAIYLTHHRHVVDIAREVCPDGVRIHEIA